MDWKEDLISLVRTKKLRGVIFDFDGTLHHLIVDWHGLRNELVEEYHLEKDLRLKEIIYTIQKKHANELQKAYKKIYQYEQVGIPESNIDEGIKELILKLAGMKIQLGVCTNNMTATVHDFLQQQHLDPYFAIIVGKDMVHTYKPDPEGLQKIIAAWGYEPDEVVFVGDRDQDEWTAKNCGMHFLLATTV